MKAKNIFKTLALAMLMPAMLLTTACSNDADSIINDEKANTAGKGYAIPVTINVTRLGDATTRATYDDTEKTLAFSSGDQLFVQGTDATAGTFAGTLTWDSGESFSGTIYTANEYSGTADALLAAASAATATLLPSGYEDYHFLTVSGDGYGASLATDATKAFATSKAAAVEQLSLEQATTYSSGFALAPQNAILNFTAVTGQWGNAPASSTVSLQAGETTVSGSVAPVEGDYERALANFAIAVAGGTTPSLTLTVDGTSVSLGTHALTAGKIYNQKCANINAISPYIQANEKWLVYGTGESSGWRLSVAEGATVTLSNVYLSDACITYMGNNTIILADGTTNTVTDAGHLGTPAIYGMMASGKSLTIKGTGSLNVTGGNNSPAIGVDWGGSCGDITIASTVHLTATAGEDQSKAITTNGGGTVTIGGVEYPDGTGTPFVYPAASYPLLSAATTADYGKVVCADGHLHDAKTAVPAGCTAVGILGKVTETGHGLILALQNANSQNWNTINGWTSTTDFAGTTLKVLPDDAARGSLTSYTTLGTTAVSNWAVAQKSDYVAIFINLGSTTSNTQGTTYDSNVNAYITTNVGGTAMSNYYWSATEKSGSYAWYFGSGSGSGAWNDGGKTGSRNVRPVLGFGGGAALNDYNWHEYEEE